MTFERLDTELIYRGRAFSLQRERLRLPDGQERWLDIIAHIGSVVILPIDQDGNLLFIRQYRQAAGQQLLELPAGMLEEHEAPEDCARRELREETGMGAGQMLALGSFYLAPGYSTEYMHVFLARELMHDPLEPDSDEFLTLERIPLGLALRRAARGEIPDAKTLAALFLAGPLLQEV